MHPHPDIAALLTVLNNPSLPGIDLSLERMWKLLAALGNPHEKLPPVIHVAGTNGKGSTIAFMRSIYEAAGYRVHVYTSPHLVRFNERIVLAGSLMEDAMLHDYLKRIASPAQQANATFFEATTALALLAFAEHAADVVLLETGLGGRLDATNVIAQPAATVLTPIDLDHQEFLGPTIAHIAQEKVGILKANVPCVCAPQSAEARTVIEHACHAYHSPLYYGGEAWDFSPQPQALRLRYETQIMNYPLPSLAGRHQLGNAALATATVLSLRERFPITADHIAQGIAQAQWPARLQTLTQGPLVESWGARGAVMLDGGHNAHAARAIAAWAQAQPTPLVMICAMMQRKNAAEFFHTLAPHLKALCCIPMPEEAGGYHPHALAEVAQHSGVRGVHEAPDVLAGAQALHSYAPATLFIAGSLYLAGHVLKNHG